MRASTSYNEWWKPRSEIPSSSWDIKGNSLIFGIFLTNKKLKTDHFWPEVVTRLVAYLWFATFRHNEGLSPHRGRIGRGCCAGGIHCKLLQLFVCPCLWESKICNYSSFSPMEVQSQNGSKNSTISFFIKIFTILCSDRVNSSICVSFLG